MDKISEFKKHLNKLKRPQTPVQIEWFVVKQYPSRYSQYRQILIEAENRFRAIQSAEASRQKALLDIESKELDIEEKREALSQWNERESLAPNIKRIQRRIQIDIERLQIEIQSARNEMEGFTKAMEGAASELLQLVELAEREYQDFLDESDRVSEEKIDEKHERDHWITRLASQVTDDLVATGRISVGNLSAIRKLSASDQDTVIRIAMGDMLRLTEQFKQTERAVLVDHLAQQIQDHYAKTGEHVNLEQARNLARQQLDQGPQAQGTLPQNQTHP